jgi:endo-1,4-beta-xylanase
MITKHNSAFKMDKCIRFGILGAAVLGFFCMNTSFCDPSNPTPSTPSKQASLKKAYSNCFVVGAAIPGVELNEEERQLLFENFDTVTPENCMKADTVQPTENRFDFTQADALVEMAIANGLTINATPLVWHSQCPDWFFLDGSQPASRELVLKRMRAYIAAVAGHFSGKVTTWEVVNEAIDDSKASYLRQSKWFNSIGEDFIAEAFIAAREADPKAELYYNDYSIERQPKRDKTLRLIRDLKKRDVPIQGVGIQGHWRIDKVPYEDIEAAIIAFHAEGLQVAITELDIDAVGRKKGGAEVAVREGSSHDPYTNGLPDEVQQRLADQYAKLFALFLKHHDKISRVTLWGLHDGRSWLNVWPYKRTNHPLFWDRALQPKPALSAVLEVAQKEKQNSQAKPEDKGKKAQ